jgi:plastocyanin
MRATSKTRAVFVRTAVTAVFAFAFLGADGCANDQEADPTPVQTFKITPAANATASPAASAVTNSPTAPPATPDRPGGSQTVAIAAVGSTFDVEEVQARPGNITVEFDNRDGGVIHNLHVFEGDDADGESVAETELDVGPIMQSLTFDAQPGEYYYQCDSHPTTMSGKLTVE